MWVRELPAELDRSEPILMSAVRDAYAGTEADIDFVRLAPEAFRAATNISVDNAVMERTDHFGLVPVDMDWTDVGDFDAPYGQGKLDAEGNVKRSVVVAVGTKGCYVGSEFDLLIALVNVEDLTVVEINDAVMITPRRRGKGEKRLIEVLKQRDRPEVTPVSRVHRPWGWCQTVDVGDPVSRSSRFAEPPAPSCRCRCTIIGLSTEHWMVVRSTAKVTIKGTHTLLTENESTNFPSGRAKQHLPPDRFPLETIEVQSGAYLAKDCTPRLSAVHDG